MKTKPNTIATIEAATVPSTPVNPNLRNLHKKERSAAIWKLLYGLGIRGMSVTSPRGAGCFWTNVDFDGVRCDVAGPDHERAECPICQRNQAAVKKIDQIILAAFPDMDDRSDPTTDYFNFVFTVNIHDPRGDAEPSLAADPASEETEPEYVAMVEAPPVPPAFGKFIGNASDVWTECRDLEKQDREHAVVFFVDVRHRLLGERWTAAIGTVAGVEFGPREVYREALARNAVGLILAHNHPSGDPAPSRQDKELTTRFRGAADLLGLKLLDHIVVGDSSFVSMASRGWM